MAAITGAVIGAGSQLYGAKKAADAASADRRLRKQAAERLAAVKYTPQGASFNGFGVSYDAAGNPVFGLGGMQGAYNTFGNVFDQGTASGLAMQGRANEGFADRTLFAEQLASGLGVGAANRAFQLQDQGFQRGLQNTFFGQAQNLAGQTDFSGLRDENLDLLRQLSARREEQQLVGLEDRLKAQGRLGSTGGARDFRQLFEAQGDADLQRQLSSIGLAQSQQVQNANIANMFSGAGQGLAGLENSLLSSAFQRFGATAGLAQDLNANVFNRGGTLFNQGLQGLQGQQALMAAMLNFGNFGNTIAQNRANTDIAAAGGAAQAYQNLGPSSGDIWGSFATSMGSNLMGNVDWSNLFGGNTPPTSPTTAPSGGWMNM